MFGSLLSHARFVAVGLTLSAASLGQTANPSDVKSDRDTRKLATSVVEPTVPPGINAVEFTVRISVGADGAVKDVSNTHALPEPLFAAAADAARRWHFPSGREGGIRQGFVADISFHGPVSGIVTTKDGTPISGVVVFASAWTCCPSQQDTMKTDNSGTFHIDHPGRVLHFIAADSYQPLSLVVTSEMSALKVTLEPATSSLPLPACSKPKAGFERIGWAKYGLQFDAPQRDATIKLGKVDTDYVVHIVKPKHAQDHNQDRVEFWFGPYAMESTPDDSQFVESETFATRHVVQPPSVSPDGKGGAIGLDTSGRLPGGKMWRQIGVMGEGARYRGVSPENAALFDKIIDSACWIPYPQH